MPRASKKISSPAVSLQEESSSWLPAADDTSQQRLEKARTYMRMIRQLTHRLTKLTEPLFQRQKLTSTQYLVLLWVKDHPGVSQSQLVELLDLDANTISDVVRRVQKKALLKRAAHATDGRAYTLEVTPRGARLVGMIRKDIDKLSLTFFAQLPKGHEAAIADWLRAGARLQEIPEI